MRRNSLRHEVRSRLAAGETDAYALWRRLQAEFPGRHIGWSYVCQIAREWRLDQRADNAPLPPRDSFA